MSWPTTTDGEWFLFDGQILMPVDPTTGAPILMLRPQGGMGVGIPALADGADGASPTFQTGATGVVELAYGDPTPGGLSIVEISPGPPAVYGLTGGFHHGVPGANGVTSLDMDSIGGTATAGNLIKVNAGATGFDYTSEKVGDRYLPTTIIDTASGNPNSTLTIVAVAAKPFDRRIEVSGHTIVTATGNGNSQVNLVAHLGTEGGNIVGLCQGIGGTERLVLSSAPAVGSADAFDKVAANVAVNVYLRTEQQSGSDSYTTSASTTRFCVRTHALS